MKIVKSHEAYKASHLENEGLNDKAIHHAL